MHSAQDALINTIPERISDSEVLHILKSSDVNHIYVKLVKDYTGMTDNVLSEWLNISLKTFRNYKNQDTELKDNLKEQVVLLISLFKHGLELFENHDAFYAWLDSENFFLDGEKPVSFLRTVTGIRFIDDRLTGMEFGDNI